MEKGTDPDGTGKEMVIPAARLSSACREEERSAMVFKCPQCGKIYNISNLPENQAVFQCEDPTCGKVFPIDQSAVTEENNTPDAAQPEQSLPSAHDVAKALALDYFSDILNDKPAESVTYAPPVGARLSGGAENQGQQSFQPPQEEPKKGRTVTQHEDAKALAREYFLDVLNEKPSRSAAQSAPTPVQPAAAAENRRESVKPSQKKPKENEKVELSREQLWKQRLKSMQEKKSQRTGCRILLFFAILIPLARIAATRLLADETLFVHVQQQILPSALYFCAAFILIISLLRRTSKPQWFFAVLLLLPLVLDAWYLAPRLLDVLPEEKWILINSGAKILFLVLSFLMSVRAGKHPLKKYHFIPE